ncbi:MAG: DUF424 family protein [Candidatus Nanoarchaeia archaeon]|nr:DUF424 family protein [Candidatus Nanoarchaeia archaeon]
MIYLKFHEIIQEDLKKIVLAAADESLIGKTIKDRNIEINVSEKFYKGKKVSEKELLDCLESCNSANLIGNETINVLLKHKIVKEEDLLRINGVPHIILC